VTFLVLTAARLMLARIGSVHGQPH
jgi:hypothetical protein